MMGIYKIENKLNHKVYIGQSVNIKKRWREHNFASFHPQSKDYNMVIHKAIRKYGKSNFDYSVIEECSEEKLNEREIYWIDFFFFFNQGYNCSKGGADYTHLGNPIELYDYDGNFVMEFPNAATAAKYLKVSYNTVYGVLQANRLSVKGYQIKRKNDCKIIKKYKNRQGGKIKVVMMDEDNNIINSFESATEAAREMSLDPSCITKCCKGKQKHCGGWKWKYGE